MDHVPHLECAAVLLDGKEVFATHVRMIVIITTMCLCGQLYCIYNGYNTCNAFFKMILNLYTHINLANKNHHICQLAV